MGYYASLAPNKAAYISSLRLVRWQIYFYNALFGVLPSFQGGWIASELCLFYTMSYQNILN